MSKLNVTITDPCHENWNEMKESENGRYCRVCEKTVMDFTRHTREQIDAYLMAHASEKICGRFRSADVHTPVVIPVPVKVGWFRSRWMAIAAAVSFLGIGKKAGAHLPAPANSQPDAENKKITPKKAQTVIHGWIRNSKDRTGIAKVEIRIYSGGKEIAYSRSFTNGSYFITIPEHTIWDYKVTLEYNAVNFQTRILTDVPVAKDRVKLDIALAGFEGAALMQSCVGIGTQTYTMGGIGMSNFVSEELMGAVAVERVAVEVHRLPEPEYETKTVDLAEQLTEKEEITETPPKAFQLKIYPNPSAGIFNVATENSESAGLMVYDLSGNLVLNKKIFSPVETVDITGKPNGTYIVLVVDEKTGQKKQQKVIKMQ